MQYICHKRITMDSSDHPEFLKQAMVRFALKSDYFGEVFLQVWFMRIIKNLSWIEKITNYFDILTRILKAQKFILSVELAELAYILCSISIISKIIIKLLTANNILTSKAAITGPWTI